MLDTIMEYVITLTGASIGRLPEDGGLVVEPAPASAGESYLNGTSSDNASLLFLCKSKSQKEALGRLDTVCQTLTRTKHHVHGIYNVQISTPPNYVGKEGDLWIYTCVIHLKFYNKEGF